MGARRISRESRGYSLVGGLKPCLPDRILNPIEVQIRKTGIRNADEFLLTLSKHDLVFLERLEVRMPRIENLDLGPELLPQHLQQTHYGFIAMCHAFKVALPALYGEAG